jgi:hypothetical protein
MSGVGAQELHEDAAAAWSEPFLRSALHVLRSNRRRLMSSLKQVELRNREDAVRSVRTTLVDIPERERARLAALGRGHGRGAAASRGGEDEEAGGWVAWLMGRGGGGHERLE